MKLTQLLAAALTAALSMALAACATPAGTKAGGAPLPVVLTVGTDDPQARPSQAQLETFAAEVNARSGGHLRIRLVFQAAGPNRADWDQQVAQMVMAGDLDLALIPSRAWDTLGVESFQAMHAPLLVDSDQLARAIATGSIGADMLRGLPPAGVVGLALVPEGLRHPFGFGRAFLTPSDFRGRTLRVPTSELSAKVFRAWGAQVSDFSGTSFEEGVAVGRIVGADSSYPLAALFAEPAIATANITLYPKINSLVINDRVYRRLDPAQRAILVAAAAATRESVAADQPDDARSGADFCRTCSNSSS